MVREICEHSPERPSAARGLADAGQLRSPHRREPVIEGAAHELVGEAVDDAAGGNLLDHPAADRLVEGGNKAQAHCFR